MRHIRLLANTLAIALLVGCSSQSRPLAAAATTPPLGPGAPSLPAATVRVHTLCSP